MTDSTPPRSNPADRDGAGQLPPATRSSNPRLQAVLGHEFFAPQQWKRRIALWAGALLVAACLGWGLLLLVR